MVELIVGKKGKGKTKVLLDKVNGAIKNVNGSIVYLDKSTKHMYELNNKIRLIDVSGYPIINADEFVGFICGIISQDHDLEQIYLDSFLTTAKLEGLDISGTLEQLEEIGEKFGISFIISVSLDKNSSVTHDVIGKFGSASVLLKKAPEGTGVIAGGPARAVIEAAGVKNIRTKSLGSNNKQNVVLATIEGLKAVKTPEDVARLRGKSIEEILG